MAAANTDKFKKVEGKFSTTLAGSLAQSATSVSLSSAAGLPTDTAVTLTIDRVDGNGTATPSKEEVITGTISGTTFQNLVRGKEGSDQAHDAGAVVEMLVTETLINDTVDGLLTSLDQDGTISADAVDTTQIADSAVETAKINDSAVTTAKINDDAVTLDKLDNSVLAAKIDTSVSWTANTSLADTGLELSLEAGTWLMLYQVRANNSVTSERAMTTEFYDNDGAVRLGEPATLHIPNSTTSNTTSINNVFVGTLGSTSTVKVRASITSTSGTNLISDGIFTAVRIASVS